MKFYTDNYSFKQTTAGLHGQIQLHTDKYRFYTITALHRQLQLCMDKNSFIWITAALHGQLQL